MQTSNIINLLQSTVAAAERVFELLDEEEQEPENKELKTLDDINGEITFDHVRFGYPPDRILIFDMNLHVYPGIRLRS